MSLLEGLRAQDTVSRYRRVNRVEDEDSGEFQVSATEARNDVGTREEPTSRWLMAIASRLLDGGSEPESLDALAVKLCQLERAYNHHCLAVEMGLHHDLDRLFR
jgi:hypothetical protein